MNEHNESGKGGFKQLFSCTGSDSEHEKDVVALSLDDCGMVHYADFCCENCKYSHPIKKLINGKWYFDKCCTAFIEQGEKDAFVLMIDGTGMCEMYSEREK